MDTSMPYDAPVVRSIGATRHEFPRLDLDDLQKFGEMLLTKKTETNQRLGEKHRLSPWERFRADQDLEFNGIPLGDIVRYGKTPEGIKAFCAASSRRAGRSDEQHAAIMKQLGPLQQFALATDLLSTPEPPPQANSGGPKEAVPFDQQTPNPKAV